MKLVHKRTKAFILSISLFLVALLILGCFVMGINNLCSTFQTYEQPIDKVKINDKKVSITIDVAWGSENIESILDVLDKYNAKATFFLVGSWIDNNEDLVKEIHKRGHEIGNHSNTHISFLDISDEEIKDEIIKTSSKIEDLTNQKVDLFRPPFGKINKETVDICKELNYHTIKWDVDSGDWKNIGHNHVLERISKNTSSGSIILFHANVSDISVHLEESLKYLQDKGYSMVSVSELIYKDNYKVDVNGEQSTNEND